MVCSHSLVGVAPGEAAQSRSWLRKQSAQALQSDWKSRGGLSCQGRVLLLVKFPSGGFGPSNAKIAGLARRTKWVSLSDGFPQRRAGAIEESFHPGTLATRVVVFANGLAHRRRLRSHHPRAALADVQVAALIASPQLAVQPQFHTKWLAPHAGLRLFARDAGWGTPEPV